MLQNILKLNGAHQLSKNELKSIHGAAATCVGVVCPPGSCCRKGACRVPKPYEPACLTLSPAI